MDTAPLDALSPSSLPQSETAPVGPGWVALFPSDRRVNLDSLAFSTSAGMAGKRVIDLTAAVLGLVMLFPLLVAIAVWIRLDSPGPVLFRQRRLGRWGRTFWIYKFRTMQANAEGQLEDLESKNEAARGVLFKMRTDPRVTRIGRFLRHTNLDELPQLINVLKGEMSLVGPRPFQMRDCDRLRAIDPTAFERRLEFPPGLTGAWQVGRTSPVDSDNLLDLDLDYVENWSTARDMRIIYRTFFIIVAGFRNPPR